MATGAPRCPAADLFGIKGRCWLSNQPLLADERSRSMRYCASLTSTPEICASSMLSSGRVGLASADVKRIVTIPASMPLSRCRLSPRPVTFAGSAGPSGSDPPRLNPRAMGGSASKPDHARGMLVEAPWVGFKTAGPLRAFFECVLPPGAVFRPACRDRPKARDALSDDARARRGLRVRPPVSDRQQALCTPPSWVRTRRLSQDLGAVPASSAIDTDSPANL